MNNSSMISDFETDPALHLPYRNAYPMKGPPCFESRPEWTEMPDRLIFANIPDRQLCSNQIRTCKYTIWTFLPLNLIVQFSKMANIYFLIVGYLETVPAISITEGKPVIWLPLSIVVIVSALKDYLEDRKRWNSDREENCRTCEVLVGSNLQKTEWQSLHVGDVICVRENEYFPADLILIQTTEKGLCYIETKNLDGETNLKIKQCHKGLRVKLEDNVMLRYEKPNPYLYKFSGSILLSNDMRSDSISRASHTDPKNKRKLLLDEINFVLRGCSLKNTERVYGIVVYTGHDTKIMLNSTKSVQKQSHLEKFMNFFIILVFFIQLVVCLFCAQYSAFWQLNNYYDTPYLEVDEDEIGDNIIISTLRRWGTWSLIFTNFVPISLMVTLEMVKFLQGIQISRDQECQSKDIPASVQSSNLNEELGQIDYIFSDKTGTITKNLMEFKTISVFGTSYGDPFDENINNCTEYTSMSNVDFNDPKLFQDLNDKEKFEDLKKFLLHLSLCHTIIVDKKTIQQYNASSPDELALVMGAKYCGFEYLGINDEGYSQVKTKDQIHLFKVLTVLDFTSSRKRMSVIIQEGDKIKMLAKGADSMITRLLTQTDTNRTLLETTNLHLEQYASRGLRTLMLGEKYISDEEFKMWQRRYDEALQSHDDNQIELIKGELEYDLELIGATGIEDKLQDDVSLVMQRLINAGIKIWMLTGDKLETAINISYSCNLLNDLQNKIIIHGESAPEVKFQIKQAIEQTKAFGYNFALILSGDTLIHISQKYLIKLMELSKKCQTVIACRVSPKQKQEIVQMVKDNLTNVTTLAIGDGANDVNMITAADIGIGIKGVEGNQAARAADYAIGEFKIIQQLVLHHGRECYRRNQVLVGYNFYKNMLIVLPHFWYSFNNGFSPLNLYDPWLYQLYNMFYTSMPIVIYAVLDEQYSKQYLIRNPQLYQTTQTLTMTLIFSYFVSGVIQSAVVIYSVFPSMEQTSIDREGRILFLASVGMAVFCYCIIVANIKLFVFSYSNTFISIFVILGSILTYMLSFMFLSQFTLDADISHTFIYLITNTQFYMVLAVILALTTLFDLAVWRWQIFSDEEVFEIQREATQIDDNLSSERPSIDVDLQPSPHYQNMFSTVRRLQTMGEEEIDQLLPLRGQHARKYTGYAFAQQEKLDDALLNAQN